MKKPKMKTAADPDVKYGLEEAEEDLGDAMRLAGRGATMGLYHASQAAEKFLGALALAAGRQTNPMWDIGRLYGAVEDVDAVSGLADAVKLLAEFASPPKAEGHGGKMGAAVRAARQVRVVVLRALGEEVPDEPPAPEVAATATPAAKSAEVLPSDEQPGADMHLNPEDRPSREPPRPPRPEGASYVRQMWICHPCGVRLPRTRQTANGAPCPHCGKRMSLVNT